MNQPIYIVRAPIFFAAILGFVFLFLCFIDRFRKKRISFGSNIVVALISAAFLLFVAEAGLQ
jgi:RsiW-degrading membrane proteinase PrsW (M82 family)